MEAQRIKTMSITALSTSFIILCSWLTVPFVIPFTMQTFSLFLILLSFGGKVGLLSVLLYLTLGAFGVPVFSSFGAGFGVLLGPSGGFLWGFAVMAFVYLCFERFHQNKPILRVVALSFGLLACYMNGAWFYALYCNSFAGVDFGSFVSALSVFVLPFTIPDAFKLILAFAIYRKIRKFVKV